MAQYKVPQDVEADDKLIGPFSFRQFVYLLIAAGLTAMAVGLFQLFPLLAIIPVPPILLLLALALPLKKDQPMETYLAAIVSFYLKPRKRIWTPGQRESTILITAPKIVEEVRKRDISEEEATHRLSFLANVVDSGGQSIRMGSNLMRDDLVAEANQATDIFDSANYQSQAIDRAINQEKNERHMQAINDMRAAIERNESFMSLDTTTSEGKPAIIGSTGKLGSEKVVEKTVEKPSVIVMPEPEKKAEEPVEKASEVKMPEPKKAEEPEKVEKPAEKAEPEPKKPVKRSIIELANNKDFSVATIAKEANRINRKDEGEVFISLH